MEREKKERAAALSRIGADVKFCTAAASAFGNSCEAAEIICPRDGLSLARTLKMLAGERAIVLGGATNVLLPDGSYDGALISTERATDVTIRGDRVYCLAGAKLPCVVSKCAKYALSGLEQLSGIPGSIGGAIAMNAGAFGREIVETVVRIDAATKDGEVVALSPYAIGAGYRHTDLSKLGLTVLGAELRLVPSSRKEIKQSIEGYAERRKTSQPQGRSAGSVFKRADGVSAGYYIERAGLKGKRRGGAEISEKHANFIVNNGGATREDFLYLSELARAEVARIFDIDLEYEVVFV